EDQGSKAQQDACTRSRSKEHEKQKEHRQESPQPGAVESRHVDEKWQRYVDERREMVPVGKEARMDGEGQQFADCNPRGGRILNKASKSVASNSHQQEWQERMQLLSRQSE